MLRHAALLSAAGGAAGHGMMTLPHSRNGGTLGTAASQTSANAAWFTDQTTIPGSPVNCADNMQTMIGGGCSSSRSHHPWMAPGTAHIKSPCGTCAYCDYVHHATDGTKLPPKKRDVWQAGAEVRAGFAIQNNHGGGYAYRLCPASEKPTEACFQKHHLQFAGDTSVAHYTNGTEVTIPLLTTTKGTSPAGSMWARNPVPTTEGGAPFGPPCPGCKGDNTRFSIVDKLVIPADLPAGDYLLSWRWDVECNAQVWTNCGDVTITTGPAPKPPAPAPAPIEKYGCVDGQCVVDPSSGVSKQTCLAVCN